MTKIAMSRRNFATIICLLVSAVVSVSCQTILFQGTSGSTSGCPVWDNNTYYLTTPVYATQVPVPVVSIGYNTSTQSVTFSVNTTFIPAYLRYVMSFSPFVGGQLSTSSISRPGSCDNNDGYFSNSTFTNWWTHLSNAVNQSASDPANTTNADHHFGNWTVAGSGCTHSIFTYNLNLSGLQSCQDYYGNTLITATQHSVSSTLVFAGTLYVNAVAPTNIFLGELMGGYTVNTLAYPFSITYSTNVVSIGAGQQGSGVVFNTVSASVNPQGYLVIQVQALFQSSGLTGYNYGFLNTTGTNSSVVGFVLLNSTVTSPALLSNTELFTYISTSIPVGGVYNGTYSVSYNVFACTNASQNTCFSSPTIFTFPVNVITPAPSLLNATAFTGLLVAYPNSTFLQPVVAGSTVVDGGTLCFKDSLAGIDTLSMAQLTLEFTYIALCFGNGTANVTYDGVRNFGCLNATYSSAVLDSSGNPITIPVVANYYALNIIRNNALAYIEFCFTTRVALLVNVTTNPVPLYGGPQFIHVAMNVTYAGAQQVSKRSMGSSRVRTVSSQVLQYANVFQLHFVHGTVGGGNVTTAPTTPAPTTHAPTTHAPTTAAPASSSESSVASESSEEVVAPTHRGALLPWWAITLIAVGSVAAFVLVVIVLVLIVGKNKRRSHKRGRYTEKAPLMTPPAPQGNRQSQQYDNMSM
jgi:hypothetical protein